MQNEDITKKWQLEKQFADLEQELLDSRKPQAEIDTLKEQQDKVSAELMALHKQDQPENK